MSFKSAVPSPLIICKIAGALSLIIIATKRVPPQEIPLVNFKCLIFCNNVLT